MTEAKRYACMPGDRFECVRTDSKRCRLTTICYIALEPMVVRLSAKHNVAVDQRFRFRRHFLSRLSLPFTSQ